jgi:ketosteroid isomerase-like protein
VSTNGGDLRQVLPGLEQAIGRFMMGDAERYKAVWSRAADVTIMGGRGAYEVGWDEVGPRLDWIVRAYKEGHVQFEYLGVGSSGDLGYTIAIERSDVLFEGQAAPAHMELRVTHLFRRESGPGG